MNAPAFHLVRPPVAVVPLLSEEPVGVARLLNMTASAAT